MVVTENVKRKIKVCQFKFIGKHQNKVNKIGRASATECNGQLSPGGPLAATPGQTKLIGKYERSFVVFKDTRAIN